MLYLQQIFWIQFNSERKTSTRDNTSTHSINVNNYIIFYYTPQYLVNNYIFFIAQILLLVVSLSTCVLSVISSLYRYHTFLQKSMNNVINYSDYTSSQ